MDQSQEAILQQLDTLAEGFSQLGTRISQAAKDLQNEAMSLSEGMAEEITASCQEFAEPCTRALELAESLVEPLLRVVTEVEEKRASVEKVRQKALRVLDRVLAITHRGQPQYPPLVECLNQARELRRTVADAPGPEFPPEIKALAERNHPFSALLTLVERLEDLDDERWERLQETVSQNFGSSLAVAASRGRLILPPGAASAKATNSVYEEAEF